MNTNMQLKESRLVTRIESELHNAFVEAVAKTNPNGTVSSVIRDFVRYYVKAAKGENVTKSERKAFVNFAEANINLEGYSITEDTRRLTQLYVEGKKNIDSVIEDIIAKART